MTAESGRVDIEGDGDLAQVCDEIERVLVQVEAPIFQRGGMLVRVVQDGRQAHGLTRDPLAPRILAFDDIALADVITRHLDIYRRNRKTWELVRVDCPRPIAQTILARGAWSFRPLDAVVEHPVMLASGRVLCESGYDEGTGLLLQLPPATFHEPTDSPTSADLLEAVWKLRELLVGFDFVDDLDESVALAFLLTAFVRPVLPTAPAFAIDAHAPGSGKSTLVRLQARLSTGRDPAFLTWRDDPVELQKLLFSALLEGDQNIAIDNVTGAFGGADVCVMLTAPVYRARVLGASTNASVPTKAVFSVNGNNLVIEGDAVRRVLVARLDPACERPAERTFSFNPLEVAASMRGHLVDAALTIMSGYIAQGERISLRPFGSFEEWSRLVREPLVWLGLPDPVDSMRVLEAADPERVQLAAMVDAVHGAFGLDEFRASELIAAVAGSRGLPLPQQRVLTDDQVEALKDALRSVCQRGPELNVVALGRWLQRMQGRISQGMRFIRNRQTKSSVVWRLVKPS